MARFKRTGMWWTMMGFTPTHAAGVFVTESVLCTAGIVLGLAAAVEPPGPALRLLVGSACLFLLAITVLLSSILSLLFYLGAPRAADGEGPRPAADAARDS